MTSRFQACAAAFVLALPAGALGQSSREGLPSQEHYSIRGEYLFFKPDLSGTMQKGTSAAEGSLVDFNDTLGLEKDDTFEIRGAIQFKPGVKLRGSYTKLDYHGESTLAESINYGGIRFFRDTDMVTTMKGAYYSGDLEWDFVKGPGGFFGALVGLRMLDLDRVLVSPADGQRVADTWRQPQPVIGVIGRAYAKRLSFEGSFAGLTLGSRGSLYEFDGGGRFHLSDRLAVEAGYRAISAKPQDGLDTVDFHLSGWHFGIELSL
jgi:hypothetical protein